MHPLEDRLAGSEVKFIDRIACYEFMTFSRDTVLVRDSVWFGVR
jgi:hypothetical protein